MNEPVAARGGFVALRLAARLARREVRHRPGRTFLVALLVAIPVAGMLVADVAVRTNSVTPLQAWRGQNGMADATVGYTNAPPRGRDQVATLLAKSKVVPGTYYVSTRLFRTVDGRLSSVDIAVLPMADPITHGIVQVLSGRPPARGNEVFLTRVAARQLGVRAGDTLRLVRPARTSFRVTGVGEMANDWGLAQMIVPPGTRLPWVPVASGPEVSISLVDLPEGVNTAELKQLRAGHDGIRWDLQVSPAILAPRPDVVEAANTEKRVRWSWVIGALVLTVAGIVIASAFAVGARRQLVTLGQLASNGAPPKLLRRVLFLQGTFTGIVGALLGFALSTGALAALAPHADAILHKDVQPYTVRASDLIPIFLLGVVTATIAALLPARSTSRIPVLAALAGRRPLGRVPKWLPITGACVSAGGLAILGLAVIGAQGRDANGGYGHWQLWSLTAIVGGVAVLLGACAVAPAYVSVLAPAAQRARGSVRIAIRSLARQRTRTGAVVSAIAATGALAIAASSLVLSAHVKNNRQAHYMRADDVQLVGTQSVAGYGPPPASLVAGVQQVLPHSKRYQLLSATRTNTTWSVRNVVLDHAKPGAPASSDQCNNLSTAGTTCGPPGYFTAAVADRALIAEYGLTAHDQALLEARGALLFGNVSGRVRLDLDTHVAPGIAKPKPRVVVAALVDGTRYQMGFLPSLLLTPATTQRLGLTPKPGAVVLRAPKALTSDQRNHVAAAFDEALTASGNQGISATVNWYTPPGGIDPLLVEWVLVGIALIFVLFVVAVNLALSATETRDERDVLTIVGAAPNAMRLSNGYKAALLTFMGAVLAIPVGFLPIAVFIAAENRSRLPLVFPWQLVAELVIALPIVAGLVTTGASAIALRIRPVRISTMAFD